MPVIVNYKICDSAPECPGIEVCPTNAIFYDNEKKEIRVNEKKCIDCERCIAVCDAGALKLYRIEQERKKIMDDIAQQNMTKKELFVDRYGAQPIDNEKLIETIMLDHKVKKNNNIMLVEIFIENNIECLINSIPVSKIVNEQQAYLKVEDLNGKIKEKYKIDTYPALLVFKEKNNIGIINGFYNVDQELEFRNKIKKIIGEANEK